jgi:flagellar hook-associated protein 2
MRRFDRRNGKGSETIMVGVRVSGLASGMDIDSIVSDLMKAERIPLTKIEKEKTLLEWKRDAYREINKLLFDFQNELFEFTRTQNYRIRNVTSTNEDFVTATVANGAGTGTYTISEITRLAKAATMKNAEGISADKNHKVDVNKGLYFISDSFKNADFEWKQGGLESESIKINHDNRKVVKLNLKEGQTLQNNESDSFSTDISIKVNGKGINVIFKTSEEEGKSWPDTDENVAFVHSDGTIEFKNTLNINDVVEVDYVVNEKKETRTLTKKDDKIQNTIQITGALKEGSINITIGDTTFTDEPIIRDGNEQNGSRMGNFKRGEEVIATINYDTGQITFTDHFLEEQFTDETETLHIDITSKQNYFTFDLATHTSEGKMYENFIVSGTTSLNSVMNKVNNSSLGLMMFYDSFTDQVTLTRTETGKFNDEDKSDIIIEKGFLTDILRFNEFTESTNLSELEESTLYNDGHNAEFTINGLKTERSSNTFTINGVSFTLKNTMEAGSAQPVTISVNNDNEKLFETIKGFVDQYNEIVEKIETKLNEPYYKSYEPLSDLEREELTEKQLEKWEEMARSGLLRRDPFLSSMITQMRSALYRVVNNNELNPQMTSLSAIGIKTTADYQSAKLQIDENKLREAIEKDPESIELLFRGGSTEGDQGIIHQLREIVKNTRDRIQSRAGSANMTEQQYTIGRQISNYEDRIERFEQRLRQLEDRYYRQFSMMEKAIMQSNNQMMQLSQFFM